MSRRTPASALAVSIVVSLFLGRPLAATPPAEILSAAELPIALDKLLVTGSVLYVAAHPDDENTAFLAYMARERKVRAAYLSVTRGDGGQNLIGSEKGERMGLIRTQELLAARRIDRAEQRFTRAVDFGYSKSPEEALRIWGKEAVLADVVWVFRTFRPDVVVTRFPKTGEGGHGHHTASALLAEEAFAAAADPARFPEQLALGARPWQAKRIFWNAWRPQNDPKADMAGLLSVDLGTYNRYLGRAYSEIAGESRSQHKSQGFGAPERRGTLPNFFQLLAGEPAKADLLEGVDLSWKRFRGGESVQAALEKARDAYRPNDPAAALPHLLDAWRAMRSLPEEPVVAAKRRDLLDVVRSVTGLWLEAVATDFTVVPGGELKVNVSALNRSRVPIALERVEWTGSPTAPLAPAATLEDNKPFKAEATLAVPAEAPLSQPYWLEEPTANGRFRVADPRLVGLPEAPPNLRARMTLTVAGEPLTFETPVVYRWTDPVKGELYRPLEIAPKVTLALSESVFVFPSAKGKSVGVTVRATQGAASGFARLRLPAGWSVVPPAAPFDLAKKGDEATVSFQVTPPAKADPKRGRETLGAEATLAQAAAAPRAETLARSVVRIDYPHIPIQTLFPPAEARLVRVDVARAGERVGYVMGSGDDGPAALEQLGFQVALLSDDDLALADLSRYSAIVVGVRAYNTRARLRPARARLLAYVEAGGTLVVQYNTSGDLVTEELGPYSLKLSRDRVTVEEAPVKLLVPDAPLFLRPNKITEADFDGWVQERGLYFPGTWDARYQPLLSMADPGEAEKNGALLVARHGKGTFVYTGLSFFRQLPAGVPGAYRLLANLVSASSQTP